MRAAVSSVPAGQSLDAGTAGVVLLHIYLARTGSVTWPEVHRLVREITREKITAHPGVGTLFHGAPALAYVLHTAGHPAYADALAVLDEAIISLVERRLHDAHDRIDHGLVPRAGEYDLISGITGLATYLMHRHDDHRLLRQGLAYLVRLTQPLRVNGHELPGWWAAGSPDVDDSPRWADGHAGFGMAHGIAGPLSLLSSTMQAGVTVPGQAAAIDAICSWLDLWQVGHGRYAWWPAVIDRQEAHTRQLHHDGPLRPSWCYGTPGIARAYHLAGRALGDDRRMHTAEQALLGCATDERQTARFTSAGLCHGWAGLAHTLNCAAADTDNPEINQAATTAMHRMQDHLDARGPAHHDGLLEGITGVQLVELSRTTPAPAGPAWDTCLLVRGASLPRSGEVREHQHL